MQDVPMEIFIGSIALCGTLVGYVWNTQGKRIDRIIKIQEKRPCNTVCSQIREIKTDIGWIKKMLEKRQW